MIADGQFLVTLILVILCIDASPILSVGGAARIAVFNPDRVAPVNSSRFLAPFD
jgi:hypothetical protein